VDTQLDLILTAEFVELLLDIDLYLLLYESFLPAGLAYSHLHQQFKRKQISQGDQWRDGD
jgi:hypothetical protein